MTLTLAEFLSLNAVRSSQPRAVVPPRRRDVLVRWVHSSEIYEIGPLLSEGDLLLTTGLGIAGADAGARRHWVRELAERGVVAIAMELGRSLETLPYEVESEARRHQLPLLVLEEVVPFIRICEEANTAILDAEGRRLRVVDRFVEEVHAALASGGGASDLVTCATDRLEAPVALVTRAEQVVAAAGVSGQRETERLIRRPVIRVPVRIWGSDWGAVVVGASATDARTLTLAAKRLAGAAAVLLGREGAGGPSDVVAPLLHDLLTGDLTSGREVLVRAGLAGFHPRQDAVVMGVAASSTDLDALVAHWREAASDAQGVELLAHPVRGVVLGLVAVTPHANGDPTTPVEELLAHADAVVTVGPAVPLVSCGRSLQEAHSSLGAATLLGHHIAVTRDLVLPRILSQLDDAALEGLVSDALHALIRWDRSHGTELVRTLDVHLRQGCSPTRTAHELHLQRQSMYQRLSRIEELLGYRPEDPRAHEGLVTATAAWRLLTARRLHHHGS